MVRPLDPAVPEAAAIAVAGDLAAGLAANVAACIAAGLAAALPGWSGRPLTDADGLATTASSHLPIPILRCSGAQFASLLERAADRTAGAVVVFPRFAQAMHTAEDYWAEHARRSLRAEELVGLGLVGPRAWIRSLTGSLPLLR